VQTLRDKISRLIQSAAASTQEALRRQLNPRLRGWANYYRHGAHDPHYTEYFEQRRYFIGRVRWSGRPRAAATTPT
jgi:hypothetical protein